MSGKALKLNTVLVLVMIGLTFIVCGVEAKTRVVIWEWISTQGEGPTYKAILDSYAKEHPEIEVVSQSDPWNQAHDKLLLMYQTGKMPDVVAINRNWLMEVVALGIVEDLTSYVERVPGMRDKYLEVFKGELNGKVYILPYSGGNSALICNTRALEKVGVEPPRTLEEFVEVGRKLANLGSDKFATQFCISEKNPTGANVCNIGPLLYSFGGKYVDETGKVAFNSEAGVKTFEWMINLEKEGIAAPGSITTDARRMREAFASERVFMTFDGAWGVLFYNSFPNLSWDNFEMPKGTDIGTVVNVMCWGISRDSKNKEAAWDLLSYLESDEKLLEFYRGANAMPHLKKFIGLPEFQEKFRGFLDTAANATNFFQTGSIPRESELYRLIVEAFHKAFLGECSAREALDEAAVKYNTLLEDFYNRYGKL